MLWRQESRSTVLIDDLNLRPARLDERDFLERLQLEASLTWEDTRASLLANPEAVALPADQIAKGNVFVAERQSKVIGFGVVRPVQPQIADLDGLFVLPDAQGSGIGRRLVAEAVRRAQALGATALTVTANLNAKGFYEACGFYPVREIPTRFAPALLMSLQISQCPPHFDRSDVS